MRLLVVEDYTPIRESIVQSFREEGYAVDEAADGEEGLWLARESAYDVIILDLMLPNVDGMRVLRTLRAAGTGSAVLILTARDSVDARVKGLDTGADDYLTKPFAMEELHSRVRALVRRKYAQTNPTLTVGPLHIDTAARSVTLDGKTVDLTAREYALLEYMAHRPGQVVTRTEVWDHVYDFRSDATSNVVDVYIGYLRKKLGAKELIRTRRGQGYILEDHT
ncbi:MAG: response regulator transcription factor [Planctomycetes bacterium]|nr:response regulator transcription factor [Planctomycetota bacterium]